MPKGPGLKNAINQRELALEKVPIGPCASADRRVELDLGGEGEGRGGRNLQFSSRGRTPTQATTPQNPCCSSPTRGPIVARLEEHAPVELVRMIGQLEPKRSALTTSIIIMP